MKVRVKTDQPQRKLVAVVAQRGLGIFTRGSGGRTYYTNSVGKTRTIETTLEQLASDHLRTPIYKGDTVEITF